MAVHKQWRNRIVQNSIATQGSAFRTESQQYFYESIALIYCADCGGFIGRAFADVPLYWRWLNLAGDFDCTNPSETDSIEISVQTGSGLKIRAIRKALTGVKAFLIKIYSGQQSGLPRA